MPDWILATFALEKAWPRLQAVHDAVAARTDLAEAWAPSAERAERIALCDPTLLDGFPDSAKRREADPLDVLMEGVLPGVEGGEGGRGGDGGDDGGVWS